MYQKLNEYYSAEINTSDKIHLLQLIGAMTGALAENHVLDPVQWGDDKTHTYLGRVDDALRGSLIAWLTDCDTVWLEEFVERLQQAKLQKAELELKQGRAKTHNVA